MAAARILLRFSPKLSPGSSAKPKPSARCLENSGVLDPSHGFNFACMDSRINAAIG